METVITRVSGGLIPLPERVSSKFILK